MSDNIKQKKLPLRKCIGCNEMKDKKQLVRIVRSNSGEFSVDLTGKMSGRGAYICKSQKCFDSAVKAKRLEKAFKGQIPDEIYVSLRNSIPAE